MQYFKNVRSVAGLKKQYKKLAMQLHPDVNGLNLTDEERRIRTEQFVEMETEYKKLYQKLTEPPKNNPKDEKTQKPPKNAKNAEKTTSTNARSNAKTEQGIPKHGLKTRVKSGLKIFAKSDLGTIVLDEAEQAVTNIFTRAVKTLRKKITE